MAQPFLLDPHSTVFTERLRLQAVRPAQAVKLFMPLRAERLYRFLPDVPPTSVEELRKQLELWSDRPDRGLCYVAEDLGSDMAVGMVRASYVGDGRALLWCRTFSHFLGRRYSREAVGAVTRLLQDAGATVEAHVDTRNGSAQDLFQAAGFERRGIIENADFIRGEPSDDIRYVHPGDQ